MAMSIAVMAAGWGGRPSSRLRYREVAHLTLRAMQILRHSRSAITLEIYTEVPSAATREALRKLGQWLGETGT